MAVQKIVIFGSTGMTGLCALDAAVKKGLNVRVFVRDPAKVPENLQDKVEIVQGDVLNSDAVNNAVKGVDGVVIVLGTRNDVKPTTDLSNGTKNIISAMNANGVKVVSACLSAFLFYEADKVPKMFVDLNADHQRMFDALKESSLDYIAINPPHIADEPSREIIAVPNATSSPARSISKWDLGKFLIDSLDQPEYYRTVVGIANTPKTQ